MLAPLSIRRTYNLDAIASAGGAAPSDMLALAALNQRLQSITVDNASNSTIAIFLDQFPSPTATIVIPAQFVKTLPINAQFLYVVVRPPLGDIMRGLVYVESTTTKLSAAGGPSGLTTTSNFVWDSSTWDAGTTWAT